MTKAARNQITSAVKAIQKTLEEVKLEVSAEVQKLVENVYLLDCTLGELKGDEEYFIFAKVISAANLGQGMSDVYLSEVLFAWDAMYGSMTKSQLSFEKGMGYTWTAGAHSLYRLNDLKKVFLPLRRQMISLNFTPAGS